MKLLRAPDGMLTYSYGDRDFHCNFHLLSEAGEPWQGAAKRALATMCVGGRYNIQHGVELDKKPWIADFAVKPEGAKS